MKWNLFLVLGLIVSFTSSNSWSITGTTVDDDIFTSMGTICKEASSSKESIYQGLLEGYLQKAPLDESCSGADCEVKLFLRVASDESTTGEAIDYDCSQHIGNMLESEFPTDEKIACYQEASKTHNPAEMLKYMLAGVAPAVDEFVCAENKKISTKTCLKNLASCAFSGSKSSEECKGFEGDTSGLKRAWNVGGGVIGCAANFLKGAINEVGDTLKFFLSEAWSKKFWVETGKSVADLAKTAGSGIKSLFSKMTGSASVQEVEDGMSQDALAASGLTKEEIALAKKDPRGFWEKIHENALMKALRDSAVKNFGCSVWEGEKLGVIGECKEPAGNYECASCHQKAMGICGMVGYSTMVVTEGFVLGAGVGAIAGTAVGAFSKVNKLGKTTGTLGRITKGIQKTTRGFSKVAGKGFSGIGKVANGLIYIPKKLFQGITKITPQPVKAMANLAVSPIKHFMKFDDAITAKGWGLAFHGTKAFSTGIARTGSLVTAVKGAKLAMKLADAKRAGEALLEAQKAATDLNRYSFLKEPTSTNTTLKKISEVSQKPMSKQEIIDFKVAEAKATEAKKVFEKKERAITAQDRKDLLDVYRDPDSIKMLERVNQIDGRAPSAESALRAQYNNNFTTSGPGVAGAENHVKKIEDLQNSGANRLQWNPVTGKSEFRPGVVEKLSDSSGAEFAKTFGALGAKVDSQPKHVALLDYMRTPTDQLTVNKYPNVRIDGKSLFEAHADVIKNNYADEFQKLRLQSGGKIDPVDEEYMVKIIHELQLQKKSKADITKELDGTLSSCKI